MREASERATAHLHVVRDLSAAQHRTNLYRIVELEMLSAPDQLRALRDDARLKLVLLQTDGKNGELKLGQVPIATIAEPQRRSEIAAQVAQIPHDAGVVAARHLDQRIER